MNKSALKSMKKTKEAFVSTTNACKMCTPLGATVAFRGIEGSVPYLHGSQGCATYMRRYIISHFREPMDIASSSLSEKHAVFGGGPNLKKGLLNVMQKYGAGLIGVATTCLTETIGDDVSMILHEFRKEFGEDFDLPEIVHVSTPSYQGTHMEGFHAAIRATAEQLATADTPTKAVNVFPGFVSAADIRYLKTLFKDFDLPASILPDYSETLDGPALEDYEKVASGGLPVAAIKAMGASPASIEFGRGLFGKDTAASHLESKFSVPAHRIGMPIGLRESDALFSVLEELSGKPTPREHAMERGRLLDAFVDGHKYISGLRAVVYGEEDFMIGMTSFLAEIGIRPVLVGGGGESGRLTEHIHAVCEGLMPEMPQVYEGVDFYEIEQLAESLAPDLLVGNSKGYKLARKLDIPLVRTGFPIHDRFGGQRILHLGYRGAQSLFDTIVNVVLEKKQSDSEVGYWYL
ncbi:nitrogenase component 1 [Desulfovibrio inopinatus]|uniref:nitrogenase component 1 n=1 Tax=Desulfovibrio inopinatus TaxID=102109 RepID=UPI000423DCEF|nr:nitrogenase component 1 [Desulfovibrio inopinatus]